MMLGMLQGQVSNLYEKIEETQKQAQEHQDENVKEHRKVHEIVDASSEALRNLDATVKGMAPHVESYKMSASDIAEAMELAWDFREKRAENRGAMKILPYFVTVLSLIGGGVGFLISEAIKLYTHR